MSDAENPLQAMLRKGFAKAAKRARRIREGFPPDGGPRTVRRDVVVNPVTRHPGPSPARSGEFEQEILELAQLAIGATPSHEVALMHSDMAEYHKELDVFLEAEALLLCDFCNEWSDSSMMDNHGLWCCNSCFGEKRGVWL